MSKRLKAVLQFANEAEEQAFWEKHDSTEYLDWTKAQRVVLPNLKPTTKTISLRLPSTFWIPSRRRQILVMCRTSR
jgi:hypothetical protein